MEGTRRQFENHGLLKAPPMRLPLTRQQPSVGISRTHMMNAWPVMPPALELCVGLNYPAVCLASRAGSVLVERTFSSSCASPVMSNCVVIPGSTSKSIVLCFIIS